MIGFALAAALFIAAALVLLVRPLIRPRAAAGSVSRGAANVAVYRDQLRELESDLAAGTIDGNRYEEARREIEHRVLEDAEELGRGAAAPAPARRIAAIIAIVLPLAAIGLYFVVGNPAGLMPERIAGTDAGSITPQQIEAMVARLAARLESNPGDAEGWTMLARSYTVLGRFKEAADAYAHAVSLSPQSAQLIVDYADALAMAQGRQLLGEPEKLIARALEIEPDNLKALALAGTVAFQKKRYDEAITRWQHMLDLVPPGSEVAKAVEGSVAEARQALAASGKPGARGDAAEQGKAVKAATRVSGSVAIAPELAGRFAPTDTLFIYARAAKGPRVPLAVLRKPASALPLEFVLDDSMAMAPGLDLSRFDRVVIGARISKSGNAIPQPGDLEGTTGPVKVGAAGIKIVIDRVVP